jgi:hypothetical protein
VPSGCTDQSLGQGVIHQKTIRPPLELRVAAGPDETIPPAVIRLTRQAARDFVSKPTHDVHRPSAGGSAR